MTARQPIDAPIPEDILATARHLVGLQSVWLRDKPHETCVELLTHAILAERERCAQIALSEGAKYLPGGPVDVKGICRTIARTINPVSARGSTSNAEQAAGAGSSPTSAATNSRSDAGVDIVMTHKDIRV